MGGAAGGRWCWWAAVTATSSVGVDGLMDLVEQSSMGIESPTTTAYYSGMIPGLIAGHYAEAACRVDLALLCHRYKWTLIVGTVTGMDVSAQTITYQDGQGLSAQLLYDWAALNIGSTIKLALLCPTAIPLAQHQALLATRPIADLNTKLSTFIEAWTAEHAGQHMTVAVVGAGAAGLELAFCIEHRLQHGLGVNCSTSLISAAPTALGLAAGSMLVCNARVRAIQEHGAQLELAFMDEQLPARRADLVILATGADAHEWPASSSLTCDSRGFIRVKDTLQALRVKTVCSDRVFASGDCASMDSYAGQKPPKAGVYAVRAAPVVIHNLKTLIDEELHGTSAHARLETFVPQSAFLSLLTLGDGTALGTKWGLAFVGRWVWHLKDHIDMTWMRSFGDAGSGLAPMVVAPPDAPAMAAQALVATDADFSIQHAILQRMAVDEAYRHAVLHAHDQVTMV
ncbi:uncharacterized protein MONBRDRAFT_26384 [Monosiga brevicollis MX1]|uniref:FAD/NAD(P)-binding domain-containing protein n=1 Tax=Monosiga brevicollis TaxID=81824 RepID=A9V277_MONBE|nr:uncharacterized protein MONBRDRAFT_26384 [Monosiga brevicollis MX1]EDQ88331.1 predicted protein [Monosiga brevicollis MX1]|eukprot:XP_001746924.1 hypothetical protein [Monosiga brevicollis MX1]